jgi:hypothetical protein
VVLCTSRILNPNQGRERFWNAAGVAGQVTMGPPMCGTSSCISVPAVQENLVNWYKCLCPAKRGPLLALVHLLAPSKPDCETSTSAVYQRLPS